MTLYLFRRIKIICWTRFISLYVGLDPLPLDEKYGDLHNIVTSLYCTIAELLLRYEPSLYFFSSSYFPLILMRTKFCIRIWVKLSIIQTFLSKQTMGREPTYFFHPCTSSNLDENPFLQMNVSQTSHNPNEQTMGKEPTYFFSSSYFFSFSYFLSSDENPVLQKMNVSQIFNNLNIFIKTNRQLEEKQFSLHIQNTTLYKSRRMKS